MLSLKGNGISNYTGMPLGKCNPSLGRFTGFSEANWAPIDPRKCSAEIEVGEEWCIGAGSNPSRSERRLGVLWLSCALPPAPHTLLIGPTFVQ